MLGPYLQNFILLVTFCFSSHVYSCHDYSPIKGCEALKN
jgi:hypothetical protein